MDQLTVLRRYLCVLRLVKPPYSYPAKDYIIAVQHAEGLLHASDRTFDRDKRKLKLEYGVDILYDTRKRGYYLHTSPDEDYSDFQQFLSLLERRERMEFLGHPDKARSISRYLLLEGNPYFLGSQHLAAIWEAIRQKRMLRFQYRSYYKEAKETERLVAPGLILEDRNRWYLVGREVSSGKVKTFGLDRLQTPSLTDQLFEGDPAAAYREQKPFVIGITYRADRPVERVLLRFSVEQSPYIKSLPIHPSQVVVEEGLEGLTVAISVVLNYELEREILGHGERVEVLEPESLRQTISTRIRELSARYSE